MSEPTKIEPTMAELAETEFARSTAPEGTRTTRVLSVGIVGAGEIVSRIHLPVLSACQGIRVAYVADKNPEAAQSIAGSYKVTPVTVADNLDQLPQTDVVLLAVPVTARLLYYELFAKRGTCVLAEKPLAACGIDAERICGLYPEYSLACGFQRRSYASVALARLVVAGNWFGRLRSISTSEGALTTKTGADSRFYDDAASGGGGVLMDLGCHSLDMAMYISNATMAIPAEQRFIYDGGVDREVEARLTLHTARGSCQLDYLVTWLRPAKNVIELRFENCTVALSCRPSQELEIRGAQNGLDVALLNMKHAGAATVYQAFYLEWMAFLDGVRSHQPSQFSARSCLPTIRAVEALYGAGKRHP
jgi:predicted dehydrogenase